jgi:hypothetical protein
MKYGIKHKDNPNEYRMQQSRERRRTQPIRYLFSQAKYRAKQKGIEFSIDFEDLIVPEYCPVFGIKLEFKEGRRHDGSFSLDRLDNSKGYTKDNTRVISWKANQYKGNLTVEEVESLLKYMKGIIY